MVYVINDEQLTRRKLVTIDGSKVTTETAIPLGLNINLPGVKAAGADVRLAKLDGTPIAREIECKDVPNADDVMIWYPWNTISGQGDQFWVYWGNSNLTEPAADSTYGSQAVWDSNYVGVWHMNHNPSGGAPQMLDSTGNHDLTTQGAGLSLINLNYGKGIQFTGDTGRLEPSSTFNLGANQMMVEMRYQPNNFDDQYLFGGWYIGADPKIQFTFDVGGESQINIYVGTRISTSDTLSSQEYNVVWTYTGAGAGNIYLNGENKASGAVGADTFTALDCTIGSTGIGLSSPTTNGTISETRLSKIIRSSGYISTTSNNQNNPTATGTAPFYLSFGLEQHQRKVLQFIN